MVENSSNTARRCSAGRARIAHVPPLRAGVAPALVLVLFLFKPALARGDATTADRAIAEQLYDRGRGQMSAGQFGPACDSFAESQRLDPGTGTLLYLAACHEAQGKLASAWVEFREAAASLRRENRPDRLRYAHEHLAAIEPRLAYLTIAVPESAEGHAPAITLDGRLLGPAVWGVAVPVDAGWHEAAADYGSGSAWHATMNLRDGQRRRLAVPSQAAAASAVVEDPREDQSAPAVAGVGGGAVITPGDDGHNRLAGPEVKFDRARIAGIALGSAGVLALGVAGYSAWRASDLWSQRVRACPMEACTADGVSLGARANSAASVSTWATVGGLTALGVATALVLWPRPSVASAEASTAGPALPRWARWISSVRIEGPSRVTIGGLF